MRARLSCHSASAADVGQAVGDGAGFEDRIDWPKIRHEDRASGGWSRWAALVVRHRWLAAGSALAVLFALIGVFLGAEIGMASSDSLAHNGRA